MPSPTVEGANDAAPRCPPHTVLMSSWLERRLDREGPRGLSLTLWVVAVIVCALAFAGLTWDVLAHGPISRTDPRIESFVVRHRVGWVTDLASSATWMGSGLLLIPLIVGVGGYVLLRHHDWRPLVTLGVGLGGVTALYYAAKELVDRGRPPASMRVGPPFASGSFPSGHSAEAAAVYGVLAILAVSIMSRHRWLPVLGAVLIVLMVGVVRVYLGTHWPSDVLAGYALGGAWLGVVAAVTQCMWPRHRRAA